MAYQISSDSPIAKMSDKDMSTLIDWIIDNKPILLADILMDKKPYIRDIEKIISESDNCSIGVGIKVFNKQVTLVDVTISRRYTKGAYK